MAKPAAIAGLLSSAFQSILARSRKEAAIMPSNRLEPCHFKKSFSISPSPLAIRKPIAHNDEAMKQLRAKSLCKRLAGGSNSIDRLPDSFIDITPLLVKMSLWHNVFLISIKITQTNPDFFHAMRVIPAEAGIHREDNSTQRSKKIMPSGTRYARAKSRLRFGFYVAAHRVF